MTKVRDPVCGMDVDTETALSAKIGDRTYYFCSQQCLDVYTAPERELKAMKRRVAVTLIGVVAALGLRVIYTFGLVATIMALQVVGGLSVYDLAIFIVSTPVVWIAGYQNLQRRLHVAKKPQNKHGRTCHRRSPCRLDIWRHKLLSSLDTSRKAQATLK